MYDSGKTPLIVGSLRDINEVDTNDCDNFLGYEAESNECTQKSLDNHPMRIKDSRAKQQ